MTTVINTPGNNTDNGDGGVGWTVAIIILLVIIGIGAYFWMSSASPAVNSVTNINTTVPASGGTTSSTTNTSSSGGNSTTTTSNTNTTY